jgi:hypothetical protein
MAKFGGGSLDHAGFNAIKDQLTAKLAAVIEAQLHKMGDDVKGITWFSSAAEKYALARTKLAA